MQLQVNQLLQKQYDIENRLRHCNLRFIGLPEGMEGGDPLRFLRSCYVIHMAKKRSPLRSLLNMHTVCRASHYQTGHRPPSISETRSFASAEREAIFPLETRWLLSFRTSQPKCSEGAKPLLKSNGASALKKCEIYHALPSSSLCRRGG